MRAPTGYARACVLVLTLIVALFAAHGASAGPIGGGLSAQAGASAVVPATISYASTVNPLRNAVQTVPSSSGAVVLSLAHGATLTEGATVTTAIPIGHATSLILPSNAVGDPFNAAHFMVAQATVVGGQVAWSIRDIGIPVATAPIVLSAAVNQIDTPTALTVVFSAAMYLPTTAGLSLSVSVGSAATITGITSGNGTTTVVFGLSRSIVNTDVLSFVSAGGTADQDLAGNLLGATTTGVTLATTVQSIPGNVLALDTISSAHATLAGNNVTAWLDQSGLGTAFPNLLASHWPQWVANDVGTPSITFAWTVTTDAEVFQAAASPVDITHDHTIVMLVKMAAPTGSFNQFLSVNNVSNNGMLVFQTASSGKGDMRIGSSTPDVAFTASGMPAGTWAFVSIQRSGTTWSVAINNGAATTAAVNGSFPDASDATAPFTIGALFTSSVGAGANFSCKGIAGWNRALTSGELTAAYAIYKATFPGLGLP